MYKTAVYTLANGNVYRLTHFENSNMEDVRLEWLG